MSIKIIKFHKHESGFLYGFLDISVPLWGTNLTIKGCRVFNKAGSQWVTLPSREFQNDQGETKYASIIGLDDEAVFKKFISAITDAWHAYCKEQQQPPPPEEGVPF